MAYVQLAQQPQQPRSTPKKSTSLSISANQHPRITPTETYRIATTCRSKLGKEAIRADLELRRLVCHANMLDEIITQLTQPGHERAASFDGVSCAAGNPPNRPSRIQWMDTISEELEEEGSHGSAGIRADVLECIAQSKVPSHKAKSPPPKPWSGYFDESNEDTEDEEDIQEDEEANDVNLSLERLTFQHRLPELTYDGDSDPEEDDPPPPATTMLSLSFGERQHPTTAGTSQICLKTTNFPTSLHLVVPAA